MIKYKMIDSINDTEYNNETLEDTWNSFKEVAIGSARKVCGTFTTNKCKKQTGERYKG